VDWNFMAKAPLDSVAALLANLMRPLGACCAAASPGAEVEDPRILLVRQQTWKLRRAYDAVSSSSPTLIPDLLKSVTSLLQHSSAGLIYWLQFIEDLVQEAERIYGTKPGRGDYKATQVKAAVYYVCSKSPRAKVWFPRPVLLDVTIDWTVDGIAYLLNSRRLWCPGDNGVPAGSGEAMWLRAFLLRVAAYIYAIVTPHPRLSPSLRPAVDRIVAAQDADPFDTLDRFESVLHVLQQGRQSIVPLLELIAVATSEAESFLHLSGAQKQEYARDLVMVFIEDGLASELPVAAKTFVGPVVDFLVDAVVMVFNKRHFFTHRQAG
jgi:hypothetical protein